MKKKFFQHPNAIVESNNIDKGTRIWAFVHILPNAVIGKDCNICDHTFIENDVFIGDRVTIKSGVQLWDGIRIEDDAFIGPNVTFTNDHFPRSKRYLDSFPKTTICQGASIGANATILPGIKIGKNAMVGAGAVVTNNVPPKAVVVGNPARITHYIDTDSVDLASPLEDAKLPEPGSIKVHGVTILYSPIVHDLRGNLSVWQKGEGLPFIPKRIFTVFDVPSKEVRGEHAHRKLKQLLICLVGSLHVIADDGNHRQEFVLDSPELALYLPPMVWGVQYRYTKEAILMVIASDLYDPDDYIRDYDQFIEMVKKV